MLGYGSTSLAPHSSLLTQTQSKEKASAKLPPAPAVAAGRQLELGTGDSHICPRLVVKELAQDTVNTGGSQNLHPCGPLLLFLKVPMLAHISVSSELTSHQSPRHIPRCHLLDLSLLALSW